MFSIVMPFCREWPQVVFTIRSIAEVLKGYKFEILAIDNVQKNMQEDRASNNIKAMANNLPWLKYYRKDDKLSSWQCRRFGVEKAENDIIMICDAHCIAPIDLPDALIYYKNHWFDMNGSMHLPLTYHILESKRLIYKAVIDIPNSDYAYTFHTYNEEEYIKNSEVFEVPAMSACGMIIHKIILESIGNIPKEMGIYGGGEHFLNYTLGVCGYKKWVYKSLSALYHHGDKRGYTWNYHDYQRNRAIATYMYGGRKTLQNWLNLHKKLRPREKTSMYNDIVDKCSKQRDLIKSRQVKTIEEFSHEWKNSSLSKGDWG